MLVVFGAITPNLNCGAYRPSPGGRLPEGRRPRESRETTVSDPHCRSGHSPRHSNGRWGRAAGRHTRSAAQPEHAPGRFQPSCRCGHWSAARRPRRRPVGHPEHRPGVLGRHRDPGRYDGFRVIDAKAPGNPNELAFFTCVSPQGDVGVYGNLVFRSVDSPQRTDQCAEEAQSGNPVDAECAPVPAPCTGYEGIQIFDIADLNNIQLVASVPLDCGSHTHTVVPDPEGSAF